MSEDESQLGLTCASCNALLAAKEAALRVASSCCCRPSMSCAFCIKALIGATGAMLESTFSSAAFEPASKSMHQ